MDTIPVSFGAIGAPLWYGFAPLGLEASTLLQVGQTTALLHFILAFFIPIWALRFLVPWALIRSNIVFILLSILSCMIPYILLAQVSLEFSSLIGGAIGLVVTLILARYDVGLRGKTKHISTKIPKNQLLKSFFPLGATILFLLLTRLPFLGIFSWLRDQTPLWTFFDFTVSASGVLQWKNIFGTSLSWTHELLYVPSIIPFLVVAILSFWILDMPRMFIRKVFSVSFQRIKKPFLTLMAALVFVKLFLVGGEAAPAFILGSCVAGFLGTFWVFFAPFLGALGAFFSGSNMISNLTFGGVQLSAAKNLDLSPVTYLALQNIGGAAGNMISISNIIAGCSVLGLTNQEGKILAKTIFPLLGYCLLGGIAGFLLLL